MFLLLPDAHEVLETRSSFGRDCAEQRYDSSLCAEASLRTLGRLHGLKRAQATVRSKAGQPVEAVQVSSCKRLTSISADRDAVWAEVLDEAAERPLFVRLRVVGREASACSMYSLSSTDELEVNELVGAVEARLISRVRLTMVFDVVICI